MDTIIAKKGKIWRVPYNFPTLQEAIDRAADGDCVAVSSGVYEMKEPLLCHTPLHIIGDVDSGNGPILRFNGGDLKPPAPLLRITAAVHIKNMSFSLDSDKDAEANVTERAYVVSCESGDSVFSRCTFISPSCFGVKLQPGVYGAFTECQFAVGKTGLRVHDGSKAFVDRCSFNGCSKAGICAQHCSSLAVEDTSITDCFVGIDLEGHVDAKVTGCSIRRCSGYGVRITATTKAVEPPIVTSCEIKECHIGVAVAGSECVADITKSVISESAEGGFFVDEGAQCTIEHNVIERNKEYALCLRVGNPRVIANTIRDNGANAIEVEGIGAVPFISKNDISNHLKGTGRAILVTNGGSAGIEGNTMHDNCANVEVGPGSKASIKANECGATIDDNISVSGEGSEATIASNAVTGSRGQSGVCAMHGARVVVSANVFVNCKLYGILLHSTRPGTHILRNSVEHCMDAIVVQSRSHAVITATKTELPISVSTDSEPTCTVAY